MLGEQIAELKGKMISHRVLDVERPTIEISVSTRGSVRGTQVNESLTYVGHGSITRRTSQSIPNDCLESTVLVDYR
jgi:hypothetical protein